MQAVDFRGTMNQYITDKKRKIPQAHLKTICQCKCGEKTCRYICLSVIGHVCVKLTPMKKSLDEMVENNKMKAMGDNCEGLGNFSDCK